MYPRHEPKNDTRVSKFMSFALRHNPAEAGITLDAQGYVAIRDLIKAIESHYKINFKREDLDRLVEENNKKRFVIVGDKIRANQGHSIEVDLQLQLATPPETLYHGTKRQFMRSIMEKGLLKGERHHVHLSGDLETARIVAARRKGDSVILAVQTSLMDQPFYISENGVWLTENVPAKFLYEVE